MAVPLLPSGEGGAPSPFQGLLGSLCLRPIDRGGSAGGAVSDKWHAVVPPRPLFGSDSEKSHHPPAIRWPPVSAGTLLTDSPAQGRTERGLAFRPAGATPPLWGSPSAWLPPPPPPPWPPRSRHLGHAIPVEVGDGAPPPGPYIPQAPLFLFKGTDCNLGAGTRLPQPLAPQKARYRPSHRPRTGARAGGTVSPEARAPSPRRPLAYAMPSVGPCK